MLPVKSYPSMFLKSNSWGTSWSGIWSAVLYLFINFWAFDAALINSTVYSPNFFVPDFGFLTKAFDFYSSSPSECMAVANVLLVTDDVSADSFSSGSISTSSCPRHSLLLYLGWVCERRQVLGFHVYLFGLSNISMILLSFSSLGLNFLNRFPAFFLLLTSPPSRLFSYFWSFTFYVDFY